MADTSKPNIFQLGGTVSGGTAGTVGVPAAVSLTDLFDMVKQAQSSGLLNVTPRTASGAVAAGPPAPFITPPSPVDIIKGAASGDMTPVFNQILNSGAVFPTGTADSGGQGSAKDMAAWQRVGVLAGGILAGGVCIIGGFFLMAK